MTEFFRPAAHKVTLLAGSWQLFLLSVGLLRRRARPQAPKRRPAGR